MRRSFFNKFLFAVTNWQYDRVQLVVLQECWNSSRTVWLLLLILMLWLVFPLIIIIIIVIIIIIIILLLLLLITIIITILIKTSTYRYLYSQGYLVQLQGSEKQWNKLKAKPHNVPHHAFICRHFCQSWPALSTLRAKNALSPRCTAPTSIFNGSSWLGR